MTQPTIVLKVYVYKGERYLRIPDDYTLGTLRNSLERTMKNRTNSREKARCNGKGIRAIYKPDVVIDSLIVPFEFEQPTGGHQG